MKYEVQYNKARNLWCVWRVVGMNAEIVKTFKTEAGAQAWVRKQGR